MFKWASSSLFCQMSTHICNNFRKNRNFLIPCYNGWVIISQIPYSGGLQDLRGNMKFLSLFLAPTANLPALLPHTEMMPESVTYRCTPGCLNQKARVWISGKQPFLASNASAPIQKLKWTWKPLYILVFLHYLSGCTVCYAAGCQLDYQVPLIASRGCSEPGEGSNEWTITKPLTGSPPKKHLMLIRA